ncbi:MAG: ABC transporter substrate-binding protein/permease [Oscillospiraceae bacterium]|jgi:His/Glu/Gln/Arg/opine family amino acid ABC transporter permease subunit|nr:ABC transporter substrate-binding protein/permease [Oscillospiraceae bacterium]
MIIVFLKRLLIICFVFLFNPVIFASGEVQKIKERGSLILATNAELPPWEFEEGEKVVGVDIDIAQKIAEKLGVSLKINNISFDALPLEIANGSCDLVLAAMASSEEREKNISFSNKYYSARQLILTRTDSDVTSPEDLTEKCVGVCIGYTAHAYCSEEYKTNVYNTGMDAAVDLINKKVDVVVIDDLLANEIQKKNSDKIRILGEPLFSEDYKAAMPKGSDLASVINEVIEELLNENFVNLKIESYSKQYEIKDNGITSQIYDNLIYKERYKNILNGLGLTIEITFLSLIIGIILGSLTAWATMYSGKNVFVSAAKLVSKIYVNIIRGTPVVCQLFIIYYVFLSSLGIGRTTSAVIAFGINSGAYVSEIIRSGVLSVDIGQTEAGKALGLSNFLITKYVIAPQALKNSIAALCNEFVQLIKETSVAGFIGVVDLARAGEIIRSQTLSPLIPLASVAIIYFLIIWVITFFVNLLEKKLRMFEIRD